MIQRTKQKTTKQQGDQSKRSSLKIIPLGGMGEIGKNITVIEYGDDMIVVDCGLKFPEGEMLGIDFVIPDVKYLEENSSKIRGLFLTHGHEDHIGGIPLIIPKIKAPIYGTALTLALVEHKIEDAGVGYAPRYHKIEPGHVVKAGCFEVGFVRVSHSIPDSMALSIKTPMGMIVHSGDFKLDLTPMPGGGFDMAAMARLGSEGVLLLMSDSTNSEREGFTPSEATLARTFDDIFRSNKDKRIVVATFASNLYRAQMVISTAMRFNRKVVLNGRSMVNNIELARKLGYIDAPDDIFITASDADRQFADSLHRVVVLTTGSQGEPFSGLVLMSKGGHKQIKLGPKDLVVISATPIPGNEKLVSNTVNRLFACGCDVIYERSSAVHVSGHASREEQKILLSLIKPKFFVPCHGEYRHLVRHSMLAREMGIPTKNIFVLQNGDELVIPERGAAKVASQVPSGSVLVDGMMLGEFESGILRERRELSESGVLAVAVTIDAEMNIVGSPIVDSRGSIFDIERAKNAPEIVQAVSRAVDAMKNGTISADVLPTEIRKRIRETLGKKYRSYPSIIPLINFVDGTTSSDAQNDRRTRRRSPRRRRGSKIQTSPREGGED